MSKMRMPAGVTLRVHLPSFAPGGLPGLRERIAFLEDLGVEGLAMSGVGFDGIASISTALTEAGIVAIGDLARHHAAAGGRIEDTAPWLDVADAAYDVVFMPALLQSIGTGDWTALRDYWSSLPATAGRLVRTGGSPGVRSLRYSPHCEELIERHGGRDGEFVSADGHGLTVPLRALLPSQAAFMLQIGRAIAAPGPVVLDQSDLGGWEGDVDTCALDEGDVNRCLVPWTERERGAGWGDSSRHPLEPTWGYASVRQQLAEPRSILRQIRRLIRFKRECAALRYGERSPIATSNRVIDAVALTPPEGPAVIELANASAQAQAASLDLGPWWGKEIVQVLIDSPHDTADDRELRLALPTRIARQREHAFALPGYGHALYLLRSARNS